MLMSTWKKLNLSRIILFSLAYVVYALYLVISGDGIYIVNVLLLASAVINGVLSVVLFFIDDEDRQKTAKKQFKKFKKTAKLFIQALKLLILAGSFVIYADERTSTSLALATLMLAITLLGVLFDLIKAYMAKKAKQAVHAVGKGIEHVKDALRISDDWNVVTADNGEKYRFKAKEQVEWWTRYVLRKKGVQNGSLVKYGGRLVFFNTSNDVQYVTDVRGQEKQFGAMSATLKDYKYTTPNTEETEGE